jgi:hypothetical protein
MLKNLGKSSVKSDSPVVLRSHRSKHNSAERSRHDGIEAPTCDASGLAKKATVWRRSGDRERLGDPF